MGYRQDIKDEAFTLFCQGWSMDAISKHFDGKPSAQCVRMWQRKYDWNERREEVRERAIKKLIENVAELNAHQFEKLENVIDQLIVRLQTTGAESAEGLGKVIGDLVKTQRLIIGKPTEHFELSGAALDSFIERRIEMLASGREEVASAASDGDDAG